MPLVVLINPKFGKNRGPHRGDYAPREPLAILSLGTFTKEADIQPKLIDTLIYEEEDIKRTISNLVTKAEKPLLFGFSVMTAQISHALELSEFVKSLDHSIPIVWGGAHPTLFPIETSQDDLVDIAVHGRGEVPLLEICEQLMSENKINSDIPGTCIKGKFNCPGKILKDTKYPWFDYDLLDLEHYLGPARHYLVDNKPNKALQVLLSRGCPWRCTFCINEVTRNRWTPLDAERYVDMIAFLIKKYKLDGYRVMDEDFFPNRHRMFAIVEGLLKMGINKKWGANIRANYFNDKYVTPSFAKKLKATGCEFLSLGAESGNQRVLDLMNKEITVEQIIHSAEVCNEAGITPIYSWMVGIPTQTKEEVLDTIEVMVEISRLCPLAIHYPLWVFRPFPGGSLYDLCVERGLRVPDTLRKWPELGADEDTNTGLYSLDNLTWIKDKEFTEFVSKYAHEVPILMNKSLKYRIYSKILYSIIVNWYTNLSKISLTFLHLARNFYRLFYQS